MDSCAGPARNPDGTVLISFPLSTWIPPHPYIEFKALYVCLLVQGPEGSQVRNVPPRVLIPRGNWDSSDLALFSSWGDF